MYIARNYKVVLFLVAIVAVSALAVTAQQNVWSENDQNRASIVTDKAVARESFPDDFKLFNLNITPLRQQLFSIVGDNARQRSTIISLPNADGNIELFEVFEASNFEPDLQAQFPEIRAFSGKGITDRFATLKLSISPKGIQTMVFRTDTLNEFIEPYSQDHTVYAVFRTHRDKGGLPWACSTEDQDFFFVLNSELKLPFADDPVSNTGQLKTMRLAQSVNAEYSNFFGATSAAQVNLVLAAINATLTRSNGVYEKDLALHLNLIANTTDVIYYDPATDPYTTLGQWNNQLQATLTANIGDANYDIGHLFGASGGGGNAGCIGCVCSDGIKGRGITSPADGIPMGDNFDIDYVVHEVGHQLGANHTFSHSLEGSGQNKEVGSGITIMSYAGITSRDVAPHSIDVFHETSIQQIQNNLAPKPCPVTTVMTENHPPVIAPINNYTIPITTPFALTGSATDPENDAITYNWEQNDNATTSGANSIASPTKLTGPNWLTFPSTTSPTRTFPRLSTILAGLAVTPPLPGGDAGTNIEALSSVSRILNFRLTVRDNRPYVPSSTIGQTQFADTIVTVTNTAGPFRVSTQNTAGTPWAINSSQTVTWDVANTTNAPVNVANVKISLSSDGGETFPTVLLDSTANDGSETITVPNSATTQARIKVEAIDNIFFDINNANFTIAAPLANKKLFDFDGDNKADISVFRPANGVWYLNQSQAGFTGIAFGASGDRIVPADYDGDGKTDVAVFRPSNGVWYIQGSQSGFIAAAFGADSDIAVPADYDGDGKSDIAVFRPSNGVWYIQGSQIGFYGVQFGASDDKPVAADYDGDGKTDVAVFRPSNGVWYLNRSTQGFTGIAFGETTDKLVPADYDGDNKADVAVFRPANGVWYILNSTAGFSAAQFGAGNDVPTPADFDGDGKADLSVFRESNGVWYQQRTTQGFTGISFGTAGDRPAPGAFVR